MIFYGADDNEKKTRKVFIREEKVPLLEDVYISDIKGKKAKLSYDKRASTKRIRNMANKNPSEKIDTSKMDQADKDTFIVPLKGGINSYNITSIKGTEVMHYFKNKFSKKATKVTLNVDGKKNEYDLMMEDSEFQDFMRMFSAKVSRVVNHVAEELKTRDKGFKGFKGVSIYPVPSSSNFNSEMAVILERYNIGISNLPCHAVSTELFKKDLSRLQKDTDFINKNKEYYNSNYYVGDNVENNPTHLQQVDDVMRKAKQVDAAHDEELINQYNECVRRVLNSYYQRVSPKTVVKNYLNLLQAKEMIRAKMKGVHWENVFSDIKYAKGASIDKRTQAIYDVVRAAKGDKFLKNPKNQAVISYINPQQFQMKNITNDIRLGMKNYFKPQEGIEGELERIKGTVFVIFDDNISGGATLSDICYQARQLGIEYIIPITFGKMNEKYALNRMVVARPKGWNY